MSRIAQALQVLRAASALMQSAVDLIVAEQEARIASKRGGRTKKGGGGDRALIVPSELDRARARRILRGDR